MKTHQLGRGEVNPPLMYGGGSGSGGGGQVDRIPEKLRNELELRITPM